MTKRKKRQIKFCHWFRPSAEKLDPGELITEKPRKSSGAANYRQSLTALIVNRRRFIITLLITARQRANKTRNRSLQKSGWALSKCWFCIKDWNALRQFITQWWTFLLWESCSKVCTHCTVSVIVTNVLQRKRLLGIVNSHLIDLKSQLPETWTLKSKIDNLHGISFQKKSLCMYTWPNSMYLFSQKVANHNKFWVSRPTYLVESSNQCPAGRVFQYLVGSGIEQNTG